MFDTRILTLALAFTPDIKVEDELYQQKKKQEEEAKRKAERPEATLDGRWNTEEERNRIFWQEVPCAKRIADWLPKQFHARSANVFYASWTLITYRR